jgi:ubiquinone/menaquinone biosynthesis C-methylase UbiE
VSVFARQFGRPSGIVGRLVGRGMARGNGSFNRWVVQEIAARLPDGVERAVELGPGPGVGLEGLLAKFPTALVWGIDLSPEMLSQSRGRNSEQSSAGRLILIEGGVESLQALAPIDLVMATHVLYFWHEPAEAVAQIYRALGSGGAFALGYQLRLNMPPISQKNFPKEGHVLYDSDGAVSTLLTRAGFKDVGFVVMGPSEAPEGRLALACK